MVNALSRCHCQHRKFSGGANAPEWVLTLCSDSIQHLADDVALTHGHGIKVLAYRHCQLLLVDTLVFGALGHCWTASANARAEDNVRNRIGKGGWRGKAVGGTVGVKDGSRYLVLLAPIDLYVYEGGILVRNNIRKFSSEK